MKRLTLTCLAGAACLLCCFIFFPRQTPSPKDNAFLVVHARSAPAITNSEIQGKRRLTIPGKATNEISPSDPSSDALVFPSFLDWANRYRSANVRTQRSLENEGIKLAHERRQRLIRLIKEDPESALARVVPANVRRHLPPSVTRLLEERISSCGSLEVFAAVAEPGQEHNVNPTFRIAMLDGRQFQAFVYGRRLGEPTRHDIALNGVAIDEFLAVDENPVRRLGPEEIADLRLTDEPVCAVSKTRVTLAANTVAAETKGEIVLFCDPLHATQFNQEIINAEVSGNNNGGGGEVAASPATEGTKRLLLIRLDFSDLPGAPFNDTTGINLVSGLNTFFRESSYGRSGFAPCAGVSVNSGNSDLTPTLRMPQTAAYYGANDAYLQLRTDARNAAIAAGYVLTNYDYDLYCFGAVPGFYWAGLGYVGWPGVWLRNYFTTGVAGHELGHNYGLNHANYWDTSGQSTIGAGSSSEYGDIFDTMGSAEAGANHFNARYKSYMNWLQGAETLNVTSSGIYRIYAHDQTESAGQRMGLRIARSATTNYWVEFRQKFTSNKWMMNGAGIRWAGNGNERSQLLDTTPGSTDGKQDSALVVGRTFSDHAAGVHITTLRKAGTSPESIDVAVNLGTFPGNNDPQISISSDTPATGPGGTVQFNAAASDPESDGLAYHWDFGDGSFGTNGSAVSKSWISSGEYRVRCTVSDMKGGLASDSIVITVGSPETHRISGQILSNGLPLEGVRVFTSAMKIAYTDSDGNYALVGLLPGTYTVNAQSYGFTFAPAGFANPVSVGPDAEGINFVSGGGGSSNQAGNVALTSPLANASFAAPSSIFLAASASASSGHQISKVEFFQGASKLGEDVAFPYSFTWNNPPTGSFALTARAIESGGIIITSSPVSITVVPSAPTITSQPRSETIVAGENASFTVTASGSAPLTYRWRFNGTNLAGANGATLSLFNVQSPQAGGYSVVVTNAGGAVTSTIATLTVTCGFSLSVGAASFGAGGGAGNVQVTTQGGCSWDIANVPTWIIITSGNGGSGSGTVGYIVATNNTGNARSATLVIAGRNYQVNQAAPDTTRPTVAISSPSHNATLTNSQLTIAGIADDNDGVLRVEYRVGSGNFAIASGSDTWSATAALIAGTNVISVRSIDLSGNISFTNTRAVFCSVPGTLNLAVNGRGTIAGATNGQALAIGRVCRLTAMPVSGYVFSNWTGDVSGVSPTLTFVMQSNLQVTANFVTNPFVKMKGEFNGLFFETNQVRFGQSGGFQFKLTDKGNYTGALRIGARKYRMSGRMNLEGRATNTVVRLGTNALTVVWAANLENTDEISGSVSDGIWTATLLGDRAVFTATNPAPQSGKHTWIILGSPGSQLGPEGDGYGTIAVNSKGSATFKGVLADKTPATARVPISKDGFWPIYVSLYAGKGALLGWVQFSPKPLTDLDGVMSWIKPSMVAAQYHPEGFTSEAALIGSRYSIPTNQILDLNQPVVVLSGGNLPQPITNEVSLAGTKLTSVGAAGLSFSLSASLGLFTGKLTPAGGIATSFKGVVLLKANYGSGHFFGSSQSGRFFLGDEQTVQEPAFKSSHTR